MLETKCSVKTVVVRSLAISSSFVLVMPFSSSNVMADNDEFKFSADALVEVCGSTDPEMNLICTAYTRGVLDGMKVERGSICVDGSVPGYKLGARIQMAAIHFSIGGISDEVLLGLPGRKLQDVNAADFVRWAFISELESETPKSYRCLN